MILACSGLLFISFSLFCDKEKENEAKKKKTRNTAVFQFVPCVAQGPVCSNRMFV